MQPKNDRLVQRVFLALMLSTGLCAHFTLDAAASADKKPTTTTNKSSTQSSPKKSSPKVSAPKVRSQSKQQAKSRAKHTTPNRSRTASRTMPTTKTPTRTYTPSLVVPTRLPTPTPTIILKPRPTITFPVTPARKNELDAILTRIGTRTKPKPTSDPPLLPKPDPEATATELPRTIPLGTEIPPNDSDDGDQGSRGGGNGCWTQCCNDGFNFWFNYGSPFWGGFGWGFGYVNDCGWWWWAGDGFCSPWWRSPWNSYCWWYPSPYWGWNQGWWNYTTVLVQQTGRGVPTASAPRDDVLGTDHRSAADTGSSAG